MMAYFRWSLTQNYPAGANPWNGTATKVLPGYTFFTPGVAPSAQEFDYAFNAFGETDVLLGSISVNQWTPIQPVGTMSSGSSTTLDMMAWDPNNTFWVSASHSSGEYSVSMDDGVIWVDIGVLPGQAAGIGPMPNGTGSIISFAGTVNIQFADYQGTVTDTGTHLGISNVDGGVTFGHPASGKVVGILDDSVNENAHAFSAVGATVTDLTASLPTQWATATNLSHTSYWTSAPGPANDQLVAFGATTVSTDHSSLLHVTWNGSAFSFANISASNANLTHILSHTAILGVAYNASANLWGLMAFDGTNSQLWTSPDLTTWTGMATAGGAVGGLAAVGPYWVTTISYTISGAPRWRAFASTDGTNFFGVNNPFGSTILATRPKMAQGPGNVAVWGVGGSMVSRRQG